MQRGDLAGGRAPNVGGHPPGSLDGLRGAPRCGIRLAIFAATRRLAAAGAGQGPAARPGLGGAPSSGPASASTVEIDVRVWVSTSRAVRLTSGRTIQPSSRGMPRLRVTDSHSAMTPSATCW